MTGTFTPLVDGVGVSLPEALAMAANVFFSAEEAAAALLDTEKKTTIPPLQWYIGTHREHGDNYTCSTD